MKLLDGKGRKVAVPALMLSVAGWIAFVVAFAWQNATTFEHGAVDVTTTIVRTDDARRLHERWFSFWGFAVGALAFYLLAFPHLIYGQWFIGVLSNFCVSFVLVTGGGVLYFDGDQIREINELLPSFIQLTDTEPGRLLVVEFAGCLVAVFFMTVYMLTWPFYTDVNNYECVGSSERNSYTPVPQYPATYPPVSTQPGIAMQPVPTTMQQGYTPGVVYPTSGAYPISAPKQE